MTQQMAEAEEGVGVLVVRACSFVDMLFAASSVSQAMVVIVSVTVVTVVAAVVAAAAMAAQSCCRGTYWCELASCMVVAECF